MLKDKGFLIFLASGLVILIVVLLLNNKLQVLKTEPQKPATYEEVKDGKYINYKYGFSFEYPEDIFTNFNKLSGPEGSNLVSKEENGSSEYNLRFGVRNEEVDKFYEDYNRDLLLPKYDSEEEKNFSHNEIIVKKFNSQGNVGYIEYGYLTPYTGDIEPTYYHTAKWLVNDKILLINLVTGGDPDTKRQKRLDILNSIVNSMNFFEPGMERD